MLTTREFLSALEGIRNQFEWRLAADTGPHHERRRTPRYRILAVPPSDSALALGPLEALCYSRTGAAIDGEHWIQAARALEMDASEAATVVAAANDRTWNGREGSRAPVEHLVAIRRRLLSAVGLAAKPERLRSV
jgi:hypothetical protein